jgi:hypothetical protein
LFGHVFDGPELQLVLVSHPRATEKRHFFRADALRSGGEEMHRQYLPRAFDYRDSRIETNATSGFLNPAQISNHAMGRVRCSLISGVDLALMKISGIIPGNSLLFATGARVIDDKGQTRNPASHALPCGISAAGKGPVHKFPKTSIMQEFVAQPYKYTNVVPQPANAADFRAEAFNRKDETGLVGSFRRFSQRVLETSTATRGVLNRGPLRLAFKRLIEDYQKAFAIALKNSEPKSSGRILQAGLETVIDFKVPYTDEEFQEDNIRTVLRGQMAAMKEFESSSFSIILLEQVESDFHENVKERGG